ncbi:hypothetical protein [Flavobacterium branchiophilum]|uniref:Uncharacterized protein n=1 Tax=Flavobacterium branchiophilum TaxID=55197 RepID=A0A2H3KHB5_9FLAO|nr:hypothetical protein [Flavobacterium branchiophilum]PDS23489.1 hypothetical protein B0A77_10720 [Flavobacterium branchiophilum]
MSEIIKTFKFESEGVEFLLHIKKGVHPTYSGETIYLDGEIKSKNPELKVIHSTNGLSKTAKLKYKETYVFFISYSPSVEEGFRWKNYDNKTKVLICNSSTQKKENCIKQSKYIPLIGDYFMESIKNIKKKMVLLEIALNDCFENKR